MGLLTGRPIRAVRRTVLAAAFVLAGMGIARAKIIGCPPGRFELEMATDRAGAPGTMTLALSDSGTANLGGLCAPARGLGRFFTNVGWASPVRVRWTSCDPASGIVALRGRFDDGCQAVRGTLRLRSGRARFVAERVPVCGDGVVGPGEECDDANDASGDCCVACRAESGCWIPCQRSAECAPYAACWRRDDMCRATSGVCRPKYEGQCRPDQFPVCGCDGRAYPSECAAWDAGVTVQGGDGLNQPTGRRCRCRPGGGKSCGPGRSCRVLVSRVGGICVDEPATQPR
jgi:cysteine-rich repeat protein